MKRRVSAQNHSCPEFFTCLICLVVQIINTPFQFIKSIILQLILFENDDYINFNVIRMTKLNENKIQDILLMYKFFKRVKRENRGRFCHIL